MYYTRILVSDSFSLTFTFTFRERQGTVICNDGLMNRFSLLFQTIFTYGIDENKCAYFQVRVGLGKNLTMPERKRQTGSNSRVT